MVQRNSNNQKKQQSSDVQTDLFPTTIELKQMFNFYLYIYCLWSSAGGNVNKKIYGKEWNEKFSKRKRLFDFCNAAAEFYLDS